MSKKYLQAQVDLEKFFFAPPGQKNIYKSKWT